MPCAPLGDQGLRYDASDCFRRVPSGAWCTVQCDHSQSYTGEPTRFSCPANNSNSTLQPAGKLPDCARAARGGGGTSAKLHTIFGIVGGAASAVGLLITMYQRRRMLSRCLRKRCLCLFCCSCCAKDEYEACSADSDSESVSDEEEGPARGPGTDEGGDRGGEEGEASGTNSERGDEAGQQEGKRSTNGVEDGSDELPDNGIRC